MRLPRWYSGKESACQYRRLKRCGFDPLVRKIPWRRKWHPLQYSCLENPMDRGAGRLQSTGSQKESDMTEQPNKNSNHVFCLLALCSTMRLWGQAQSRQQGRGQKWEAGEGNWGRFAAASKRRRSKPTQQGALFSTPLPSPLSSLVSGPFLSSRANSCHALAKG